MAPPDSLHQFATRYSDTDFENGILELDTNKIASGVIRIQAAVQTSNLGNLPLLWQLTLSRK